MHSQSPLQETQRPYLSLHVSVERAHPPRSPYDSMARGLPHLLEELQGKRRSRGAVESLYPARFFLLEIQIPLHLSTTQIGSLFLNHLFLCRHLVWEARGVDRAISLCASGRQSLQRSRKKDFLEHHVLPVLVQMYIARLRGYLQAMRSHCFSHRRQMRR